MYIYIYFVQFATLKRRTIQLTNTVYRSVVKLDGKATHLYLRVIYILCFIYVRSIVHFTRFIMLMDKMWNAET